MTKKGLTGFKPQNDVQLFYQQVKSVLADFVSKSKFFFVVVRIVAFSLKVCWKNYFFLSGRSCEFYEKTNTRHLLIRCWKFSFWLLISSDHKLFIDQRIKLTNEKISIVILIFCPVYQFIDLTYSSSHNHWNQTTFVLDL